jgi:hypothetical protein
MENGLQDFAEDVAALGSLTKTPLQLQPFASQMTG